MARNETRPVAAANCWGTTGKPLPGATTKPDQSTQAGTGHSAGQRWAGRGELIAKVGTVISAIMASSCCWLPVLLLTVGVSGAGIASALEAYRPIFMAVTFSFLAMAFYFTYRPRNVAAGELDCCAEPVLEGTGSVPTSPGSSPSLAKLDIPAPASGGKWRFNMMAMNKVMLWGVTVLAVVFLFFPSTVTGLLGSGSEQVTAGMTRTELRIKGMTCDGWRVKAVQAIHQAPGVLAVDVNYEKGMATVGTEPGSPVPREAILESIRGIGYQGEFVDQE